MEPAKPPLPTPRYFPFHVLAGSHTSTSMSESRDGLIVASTRQNAGSRLKPLKNSTELRRPRGGRRNAPGATVRALVILALGKFNFSRLSQVAALATGATTSVSAAASAIVLLEQLI